MKYSRFKNIFTIFILILFGLKVLLASLVLSKNLAQVRSRRLPNNTYPLHYYLHFISNIHLDDFNYNANVTIDIDILTSTNEIVLHSKNLYNLSISILDLRTNELIENLTYSFDTDNSFLIIYPYENDDFFKTGQRIRVEILYSSIMQTKTNGFYWLTYNSMITNRTTYLAATQFEPTNARMAFPCYDEPAFKSNFSIKITHGQNYSAISNMNVKRIIMHSMNLSTTTFYTTPPMSTYLVAFVISDYEYITEKFRKIEQRVYTPPGSSLKGFNALKNAIQSVAFFEDYFEVDYPLPKLDHIALQKSVGAAMENWGLITYREIALIYEDEEDSSKKCKDIVTQTHEIAHQWFGNLVSPQWWTYAWLNEGFATYFAYIITDLMYPEFKAMDLFLFEIAERAYSYSYINIRPMSYYVETETEIAGIFDIISYQRAACVIKMFHHAFNQNTFVKGIISFLHKYQYLVANEIQLFNSIQTSILEDIVFSEANWTNSVQEIMLSWTHSKWIPIVSIMRNYEENSITIQQQSKDINSPEYWWIPLNFATASQYNFEHTTVDYFMPPVAETILTLDELGIVLNKDDWLIVNKQQTGFYHVHYDIHNLKKIAKQLQDNHNVIHKLNRASIFQDLTPLIENNEIESIEVIFELLNYLQYEEEVLVWNQVADIINLLKENIFFYNIDTYELYKRFIYRLISPIFKKEFYINKNFSLIHTDALSRMKIMEMACIVDEPSCLEYTRAQAHGYIFQNISIRKTTDSFAISDSILCQGVKYLSDTEFNNILQILSKTERDSLKYDDLIYALRCTQNLQHIQQYLYFLLGENSTQNIMNDSDSMMYLIYLYKANLVARPVMWEFFEENYKILCKSPFFIENFNRIAEYIPNQQKNSFIRLRESIAQTIKSNKPIESHTLISSNSHRIGQRIKMAETFSDKFGQHIYDWLKEKEATLIHTAAVLGNVKNGVNRLNFTLRKLKKLMEWLSPFNA